MFIKLSSAFKVQGYRRTQRSIVTVELWRIIKESLKKYYGINILTSVFKDRNINIICFNFKYQAHIALIIYKKILIQ